MDWRFYKGHQLEGEVILILIQKEKNHREGNFYKDREKNVRDERKMCLHASARAWKGFSRVALKRTNVVHTLTSFFWPPEHEHISLVNSITCGSLACSPGKHTHYVFWTTLEDNIQQ